MRRIYTIFCALFCAFALFADDVTGFVALEYGGNKTSYLIKNVQHVDVNSISANQAEMSVLRKDGVSMPNVRTLIFTDEVLFPVQFVNYDGTVLQSSEMSEGETPKYNGATPTKPATAEFTYTFAGWSPSITAVTGAQTYTATYTNGTNQYEVIFQNEDGTVLQRSNVTYGETPKYNGATPTKPATAEFTYTFAGWSPAITMVEGTQTYTATYSSVKNQYEIIFQNEDGTELQRSNVTYGETPVYAGATPTKPATAEFT